MKNDQKTSKIGEKLFFTEASQFFINKSFLLSTSPPTVHYLDAITELLFVFLV